MGIGECPGECVGMRACVPVSVYPVPVQGRGQGEVLALQILCIEACALSGSSDQPWKPRLWGGVVRLARTTKVYVCMCVQVCVSVPGWMWGAGKAGWAACSSNPVIEPPCLARPGGAGGNNCFV